MAPPLAGFPEGYRRLVNADLPGRPLPAVPGADISSVRGDVRPVYERMAAAAGNAAIWVVGGGDLAGQFADAGLLDEVIVSIAPATLGAGAPLLPRRLTAANLELVEVDRLGQFAQLSYRVSTPPRGAG